MIINKGNLRIASLTTADKQIPVLDNVFISKLGTTVAANGRCVIAVSPPPKEIKKTVPFDESLNETGFTVSRESIQQVLKAMPKDTIFKGLLEHCDVKDTGESAVFTFSDGKRLYKIEGRKYGRDYIDYRSLFQDALSKEVVKLFVVNQKRLLLLLKTISEITEDASGESPVCISINVDDDIVIRAINRKTNQRVLALMTAYKGAEKEWPTETPWEYNFRVHKKFISKSKNK
jgi:hypothetical protein